MLKNKLIHSIEALAKNSQNPDRIKRLVDAIKEKDIQDQPVDYWKALRLIFIIYLRWPTVRTHPDNKELISLGNECIKKSSVLLPAVIDQIHFLHKKNLSSQLNSLTKYRSSK